MESTFEEEKLFSNEIKEEILDPEEDQRQLTGGNEEKVFFREELDHHAFNAHDYFTRDDAMDKEVEDEDDFVNNDNDEKECPVDGCSEKVLSSKDLVEHMRKHPAPWICGVCKHQFSRRGNLRLHYRIHTGEKPFKCGTCQKGFAQSQDLNIHKRIHTGERPYECDECDYKTSHLSTLKIHKRKHTGEKPFSCTTCGFQTANPSSLYNHKKRHYQ